MHYVNTTFDFLGNSLLEKEKYLVIESSNFLQSNSKEVSKIYCSFSFVKRSEIKETSSFGSSFQVRHLFTVLSLNSDGFCQFYFLVKTPLHCTNLQREGTILNQSIQRHFLPDTFCVISIKNTYYVSRATEQKQNTYKNTRGLTLLFFLDLFIFQHSNLFLFHCWK